MSTVTPLGTVLLEEGRTQTWLAIQIAARIGRPVYRQEVSRWVLGVFAPQDATKIAIAEALGRTVAELWPPAVPHDVEACTPADPADTDRRDDLDKAA